MDALEVQQEQGPLQLIDLTTGVILLEAPEGKRTLRLSVPPGRYLVRRVGEHGNFTREFAIAPGASVTIREEELTLSALGDGAEKGGAPIDPWTPRASGTLTPAGGPLFAFLASYTRMQSSSSSDSVDTAPTAEGALRLGWAFPALHFDERFQPQLSLFFEGRLGIAAWPDRSGGGSFERALMVRAQANVIRTHYVDLYLNLGFGRRAEDGTVSGAFSAAWGPCKDAPAGNEPGSISLGDGTQSEPHSCGLNEWRFGVGLEGHLFDSVHLFAEPDFSLSGHGANALRLGLLFR